MSLLLLLFPVQVEKFCLATYIGVSASLTTVFRAAFGKGHQGQDRGVSLQKEKDCGTGREELVAGFAT